MVSATTNFSFGFPEFLKPNLEIIYCTRNCLPFKSSFSKEGNGCVYEVRFRQQPDVSKALIPNATTELTWHSQNSVHICNALLIKGVCADSALCYPAQKKRHPSVRTHGTCYRLELQKKNSFRDYPINCTDFCNIKSRKRSTAYI